jgi:hypothetical protein
MITVWAQMFQLGHQPFGVGFVASAAVPVSAQVMVGLVALEHPVGRNQDRVRDGDLGPAHPPAFQQPGVLGGQIVLAVHPPDRAGRLDQHRGQPFVYGLDAIMLAPTRELVGSLNQRAQDHRIAGKNPGRQVDLADGTQAGVDDLVITRRNDRRLRLSPTDWVKNGDRWTVFSPTSIGGLRVWHARSGRMITLPRDYVQTAVELGYATTVHTAQGVTADTMHGVVTGEESRQQLYAMLTRGRAANHVYLSVVGDGNPHTLLEPGNIHLRTATEPPRVQWRRVSAI